MMDLTRRGFLIRASAVAALPLVKTDLGLADAVDTVPLDVVPKIFKTDWHMVLNATPTSEAYAFEFRREYCPVTYNERDTLNWDAGHNMRRGDFVYSKMNGGISVVTETYTWASPNNGTAPIRYGYGRMNVNALKVGSKDDVAAFIRSDDYRALRSGAAMSRNN